MNVNQSRVSYGPADPWSRITYKGFGVRSSALHLRSSAFPKILACMVLAVSSLGVAAGGTATDAWVRGTVPAQKTTGAFLTLHSTDYARIVAIRSQSARSVEIHSSEMENGVMRMQAMDDFLLLPGKSVELKPGGYHVMLMGLTRPLAA